MLGFEPRDHPRFLLREKRNQTIASPSLQASFARSRCRRYYRLTTTRTTLSRRDSPPSITLSAIFPPQFAPSCNELNLPVETRLLPRIVPTNRYGKFYEIPLQEERRKGRQFLHRRYLKSCTREEEEKSSYSNDNAIPTN